MVGYCKVPKVPATVILRRVLLLLGCQLCNFNSACGGSFLVGGMCGRDGARQGGWRGLLLELYSCLAADGSHWGLSVKFKRCGSAMFKCGFILKQLRSCYIKSLYNLVSLYSKLFCLSLFTIIMQILQSTVLQILDISLSNRWMYVVSYLDPRPPYVVLYYFFLSNYVQKSSAAIPAFCATWFVSKIY